MATVQRKRIRTKLFRPEGVGTGTFIVLPFDARKVFGAARAKVRVTIGKHSYRSTVSIYGGKGHIIVRESNRVAAGVKVGDTVDVLLERDDAPRVVRPPRELSAALEKDPSAKATWDRLSYTHKREHADAIAKAKKSETRMRRVAATIEMLHARPTRAR